MAIQIRRGDYDDLNPNSLLDGEFCATTQDDPNTASGRALYIKNGTFQRVLTESDLQEATWTLLDTITLSENVSSVSLFATSQSIKEYLIVFDGEVTGTSGGIWVSVGDVNISFSSPTSTTLNKSATIKRLVDNDALVNTDTISKLVDIDNKQVYLKTGAINMVAGSTITIYAR